MRGGQMTTTQPTVRSVRSRRMPRRLGWLVDAMQPAGLPQSAWRRRAWRQDVEAWVVRERNNRKCLVNLLRASRCRRGSPSLGLLPRGRRAAGPALTFTGGQQGAEVLQ